MIGGSTTVPMMRHAGTALSGAMTNSDSREAADHVTVSAGGHSHA